MNKYLIYEGGQPVYLDDFAFLQSSFTDVIKGLCSALKFGEKNILLRDPVTTVLSGTNTIYTVASGGYIVIGDEIYPIQAGELVVPTSQAVYFVVTSEKYQSETLSNNTEVQVYERRYVKLSSAYMEGDIYARRAELMTVQDKLLATIVEYLDKPVMEAEVNTHLTLNNVVSGGCTMIYKRKQSGGETVYIKLIAATYDGDMSAPVENGKAKLFTFDTGIKAVSAVFNVMMLYADNWNEPYSIPVQLIFENGSCYIASADGSPIERMPGRTIVIEDTFNV